METNPPTRPLRLGMPPPFTGGGIELGQRQSPFNIAALGHARLLAAYPLYAGSLCGIFKIKIKLRYIKAQLKAGGLCYLHRPPVFIAYVKIIRRIFVCNCNYKTCANNTEQSVR